MNCNECDRYIDKGLNAKHSDSEREQFLAHTESCASCSLQWREHQQYLAIMAGVNEPDINPKVAAILLRTAAKPALVKQPFVQGFMAASVLAVAVLIGVAGFNANSPNSAPLATLGSDGWSQDVTIAITVPHDMDGAQLVLRLPDDISIEGYEYLSQVQWPVSLKQGRNTIVLPVSVDDFAQYAEQMVLSASLIYNNVKKDFELDLNLGDFISPA